MMVLNLKKNPNPTPKQNQQDISHAILKLWEVDTVLCKEKHHELASLMKFHTMSPSQSHDSFSVY